MISRKHCIVTNNNGTYYLTDEGSANGTFVNGIRLTPHEMAEVKRGDVIRMANSDFQLI